MRRDWAVPGLGFFPVLHQCWGQRPTYSGLYVCRGLLMAEGTPPALGLSFPAVSGEVGVGQSESP